MTVVVVVIIITNKTRTVGAKLVFCYANARFLRSLVLSAKHAWSLTVLIFFVEFGHLNFVLLVHTGSFCLKSVLLYYVVGKSSSST